MTLADLPMLALQFALLLPALVLHEVAHGWMAYRLGDPTAKLAGRLNLDPRKHIDPWGTVAMPLLLLFVSNGRFMFGYAKPVPFDPRYFKDRKTGMLLTGIAGPAANLVLAIAGAGLFRGLVLLGAFVSVPSLALQMVYLFVYMNLFLMFFNLLPIPPMDGSRVVQRFLSGRAAEFYAGLERYGFVIIIVLLYIGRPLLDAYLNLTLDPVVAFLTGVAG
ncbi:MAG: site-2 protease family protein [Coriobacteriia bacterium]|nr:site-2 protease family protein [Coriobacteriia bacterium]